MSISSSGARKAGPFSGNGATTAFPFSFKVFQASDLLVVQTDTTPTDHTLALNTDYTVALNANQDANPGGTVTTVAAPPAGYLLTIGSQVPQVQSVTLTNNGGFYPTVINTALDYLTILVQQLSEKIGRALVMPFSTNASGQLPPVAPGQLLGWKADGSGIANVGASGVGAGGIVASNMAAGATGAALSVDMQAAATKAAPADADEIPLFDSANFWYLKSLTWANLKAAARTYIASLLNMTGAVNEAQTTVASAATPDIWTSTGNIINYTGTVTATGFASAPQAGARRVLDCAAAAVFTAGTNMLIDGVASGSNLTVAAGDRVEVYARTTTQFVLRWIKGDGTAVSQASTILPIGTPSVAANALTVPLGQMVLEFRSPTQGNGGASRVVCSAQSIVVPSGATLGSVNGVQTQYALGYVYSGGAPVPIIGNIAGLNTDESTFVSPTTISASATSAGVWYSASAVSANSPFRIVGFLQATETTAGTWVTAPSLVQGLGGLADLDFGFGQTWQNVVASRALSTNYYNTKNKPIKVNASALTGTANAQTQISVAAPGGSIITLGGTAVGANVPSHTYAEVPPGWGYSVSSTGATPTLVSWAECS